MSPLVALGSRPLGLVERAELILATSDRATMRKMLCPLCRRHTREPENRAHPRWEKTSTLFSMRFSHFGVGPNATLC